MPASDLISNTAFYRVIYGDTDNMGVVYHANYLRWFEIGRSELFRSMGLPYKKIEQKGLILPVSEVGCKYLLPARYDDLIRINATLNTTFRAGMQFEYTIKSEDEKILHARGFTKHAFVNGEGKVIRPPKFITTLIKNNISGNY